MLASTHRHGKHPRRGRRRPDRRPLPAHRARPAEGRPARGHPAAAATLFAERGYAGVTIEDLGAAVGVSGPAVYRHFPGKAAVLAAILQGREPHAARRRRGGARRGAGRPARFARSSASTSTSHSPRPTSSSCRTASSSSSTAAHGTGAPPAAALRRALGRHPLPTPARSGRGGARVPGHAAFGLLNSTPHSARIPGRRPADGTIRGILEEMTWASLMS